MSSCSSCTSSSTQTTLQYIQQLYQQKSDPAQSLNRTDDTKTGAIDSSQSETGPPALNPTGDFGRNVNITA